MQSLHTVQTTNLYTYLSAHQHAFRRFRYIAKKLLLASSCPSVRPHGTTWLPLDGFSCNLSTVLKFITIG